ALTSPAMNFAASELGTSRLVKGAPYSAEAISESTQVLMDGNKIQRRAAQRLARDGEGRTRVERLRRDGTVESVTINDVVAGKRYWLLPDKKRVVELGLGGSVAPMRLAPMPPATPAPSTPAAPRAQPAPPASPAPPAPPPSMSGEEARTWAEDMRRWARDFTSRWRAEQTSADDVDMRLVHDQDATGRVIVKRVRGTDGEPRSVDVDVVRVIESANNSNEAATAAIAAIPPVPLVAGPTGQGVTTALGSKEFDRIRADGSRTTWTIPAGKIGNEKPIDVVSERWYSPELLLVVSSRYFDPRRGETTYRLTGLKRGEPDASLFQVPADFERRPTRLKHEERGRN
ncbi:MAG TPA: hypothetical protein VEN28_10875, partial [Burkholderiaceae bacterium]|nr:hypothetical protein [Burkholderiaceae bacterium]